MCGAGSIFHHPSAHLAQFFAVGRSAKYAFLHKQQPHAPAVEQSATQGRIGARALTRCSPPARSRWFFSSSSTVGTCSGASTQHSTLGDECQSARPCLMLLVRFVGHHGDFLQRHTELFVKLALPLLRQALHHSVRRHSEELRAHSPPRRPSSCCGGRACGGRRPSERISHSWTASFAPHRPLRRGSANLAGR